jgi:dihydrofolate reductase
MVLRAGTIEKEKNRVMEVSIIACVATGNFAIGRRNDLCYRIKDDMKHFKELTRGHPIIMGSNTFRSLPGGALSGRRNIVLSRQGGDFPGCEVYSSLQDALRSCQEEEHVFIIGGGQVYREAYPLVDSLYLTEVFDTPEDCDVFFPSYFGDFECKERQYFYGNDLRYEFTKYARITD